MRKKTVGIAGAIALAGSIALAGPASADPKPFPGQAATLECAGVYYDITVNGNGEFTPAHDSNSTKVWIPIDFGASYGAVYATDDNELLDEFYEADGVAKGGERNGQGVELCHYHVNVDSAFDEFYGEDIYGWFAGKVYVKIKAERA